MSNYSQHRLRRIVRQRRRGQSIPIIALMIVILVAMVGLSVDVGNTFSHERETVSASNAAAITGMSTYLQYSTGLNTNITPGDVYNAVERTLAANGVVVGDDAPNKVRIHYIDTQGNLIGELDKSKTKFPDNVGFLQVEVNGKVDTSFARVVGRPDLPINAQAYAGRCPYNDGVYPIGIDSATITGDSFNNKNLKNASDPNEYKVVGGQVQRRLYVMDTQPETPGSFVWLRWKKAVDSASELADSLGGAGNVGTGIEEPAWPKDDTAPTGYPLYPGTINEGDWIWGSAGWEDGNTSANTKIGAAIKSFIDNKTQLILPIYRDFSGADEDAQFLAEHLGVFKITKKSTTNPPTWIDVVYLGPPDRQEVGAACLVTAPPPPGGTLDLFGNVSLFPEYAINELSQAPIQYVVVLDGSGSMSANFAGECNNTWANGHAPPVQCANGGVGSPDVEVDGTGPNYFWSAEKQRRIYVAKKALERLVKLANMPGAGYETNRPSDQMAVVWFREYVNGNQVLDFTNNKNTITNFITDANSANGDYRSEGGTNGAAGLYKAKELYQDASKTVKFNTKDVAYKRVVLFITDGVSNHFLSTSAGNLLGSKSEANTYPTGSYCRGLGKLVVETASCQLTDPVKSPQWNGWDRPITQMIDMSSKELRNDDIKAEVFVIALSSIPSTGLRDGVASSSNYFFSAESLETYSDGTTNVDGIIDEINAQVEDSGCTAGPSGSSTGKMTTSEFSAANPSKFAWSQVGQVTITKAGGFVRTAPIMVDKVTGFLSYEFKDVPEGAYTLSAFMYYHHPDDAPGVLRTYGRILDEGEVADTYSVIVSAGSSGAGFNQRIETPITLKNSDDVCPKTTP